MANRYNDIAACTCELYAELGVTLADGGGVSQWADQSGNANHAAPPASTNAPRYPGSLRTSIPAAIALDFNVANGDNTLRQYLTVPALQLNASAFTIAQVVDLTTSQGYGGGSALWGLPHAAPNNDTGVVVGDGYGGLPQPGQIYYPSANAGGGTRRFPAGECLVLTNASPGGTDIYVNDMTTPFASFGGNGTGTLTGFAFGNYPNGNYEFLGNLLDVAAWNNLTMNLAQRQAVAALAVARWKLPLAPKAVFVCGGDSYGVGPGATGNVNVVRQVDWQRYGSVLRFGYGNPGTTTAQQLAQAAATYDVCWQPALATNVFFAVTGINDNNQQVDPTASSNNVLSLMAGRRAAGATHTITTTTIPFVSSNETNRLSHNAKLRAAYPTVATFSPYVLVAANGRDYLLDVAALPTYTVANAIHDYDNYSQVYTNHQTTLGYGSYERLLRLTLDAIFQVGTATAATVTGSVPSSAVVRLSDDRHGETRGTTTANVAVPAGATPTRLWSFDVTGLDRVLLELTNVGQNPLSDLVISYATSDGGYATDAITGSAGGFNAPGGTLVGTTPSPHTLAATKTAAVELTLGGVRGRLDVKAASLAGTVLQADLRGKRATAS